ncbi:MAG TPA: hypothetical protein VMR75_02170 [Candidatus Saccharimonadales bacterium]|nr:hypothetical protein [Candidatus Saccharimonadales bacterium]
MNTIIKDFPQFTFVPGKFFMWSPHTNSILYDKRRSSQNDGKIALVHEIGHALLGHRLYRYDMELMKMEMDAWDQVRQLAPKYNLYVDEEHIARCIATYDEWLTKRATCPDCQNFSLQKGRDQYGCFACGSIWRVNWRKDRRVTRRVVERYEHPQLAQAQFSSK